MPYNTTSQRRCAYHKHTAKIGTVMTSRLIVSLLVGGRLAMTILLTGLTMASILIISGLMIATFMGSILVMSILIISWLMASIAGWVGGIQAMASWSGLDSPRTLAICSRIKARCASSLIWSILRCKRIRGKATSNTWGR